MGKVKVTKEVADALSGAIAKFDGDKGGLLETHARTKIEIGVNWETYLFAGTNAPLDVLTTDEMARALYVGYEIEKSPEERIKLAYECSKRDAESGDYDVKFTGQESMKSIVFVLDVLDIKIEGVNV